MPNQNYDRGSKWEHQIIKAYEKQGFFCMRSAGSHTVVDVLAMKKGAHEVHLIQCKSSDHETLPDLHELLKPTEKKKERQQYYAAAKGEKRLPIPRETFEVESNIKLLEDMYFATVTYKRILWKGFGRKNWWLIEYQPSLKQWTCKRILQII